MVLKIEEDKPKTLGVGDDIVEVEVKWRSGRREVYPMDFIAKKSTTPKIMAVYIAAQDGADAISIYRGIFSKKWAMWMLIDLRNYFK
jgi:hypothetical protein